MNLRIESSRLAIVPRLRTSPSGSAMATAIVSAWTSMPKNRNFSLMTGSSACGSGLEFVKQTQPNPRLAQRAGHYIMTNPLAAVNFRLAGNRPRTRLYRAQIVNVIVGKRSASASAVGLEVLPKGRPTTAHVTTDPDIGLVDGVVHNAIGMRQVSCPGAGREHAAE